MPAPSQSEHGPFTFMSEHERGIVGAILNKLHDKHSYSFTITDEEYERGKRINLETLYDSPTRSTRVKVRKSRKS